MSSGVNIDIAAKAMLDDPALSGDIYFYHDDTRHNIAAAIKRNQVAGLILYPQKSCTMPLHR